VLKPPMFGLAKWWQQFNPRQAVALATFTKHIRSVAQHLPNEYAIAVSGILTMVLGRLADKCAIQCVWNSPGEKLEDVFGRQAIPMSWDYGELNPFSGRMGDWLANIEWVVRSIETCSSISHAATVSRGSATRLPLPEDQLDAVLTDPPYYDAVP